MGFIPYYPTPACYNEPDARQERPKDPAGVSAGRQERSCAVGTGGFSARNLRGICGRGFGLLCQSAVRRGGVDSMGRRGRILSGAAVLRGHAAPREAALLDAAPFFRHAVPGRSPSRRVVSVELAVLPDWRDAGHTDVG